MCRVVGGERRGVWDEVQKDGKGRAMKVCSICRDEKPEAAKWCYHCTKQVETILDCNHRVIRERLRLAKLRVKWLEAALGPAE